MGTPPHQVRLKATSAASRHVFPLLSVPPVQGSCFLCGHHSLDPPCLSGHGRHFAVPRIQIQFSEPSLGTPAGASPPGVCGEPGVNTSNFPAWGRINFQPLP